jgi:hypothetical protein
MCRQVQLELLNPGIGMGEKRDERRILVGKPERKGPFLSPRPDERIK